MWKKEHKEYFVRELLVTEPYMNKPKSTERGQAWRLVAENLNKLDKPKFRVTFRSAKDRYTKLVERYKKLKTKKLQQQG